VIQLLNELSPLRTRRATLDGIGVTATKKEYQCPVAAFWLSLCLIPRLVKP
jgi:hypothetical protein